MLKCAAYLAELLAWQRRPRREILDEYGGGANQRYDRPLGVRRCVRICLGPEYGIAGMQSEMRAQKPLAIAPAELEIVLAKLLVEEAAERVERAAGERRRAAVPLGRNQIAAVNGGIRGSDEIGGLEARLIDERRNEGLADEAHAEVAGLAELVEVGHGLRRERRDQDDGAVGRSRVRGSCDRC